jgi:hypothetical protein
MPELISILDMYQMQTRLWVLRAPTVFSQTLNSKKKQKKNAKTTIDKQ